MHNKHNKKVENHELFETLKNTILSEINEIK